MLCLAGEALWFNVQPPYFFFGSSITAILQHVCIFPFLFVDHLHIIFQGELQL